MLVFGVFLSFIFMLYIYDIYMYYGFLVVCGSVNSNINFYYPWKASQNLTGNIARAFFGDIAELHFTNKSSILKFVWLAKDRWTLILLKYRMVIISPMSNQFFCSWLIDKIKLTKLKYWLFFNVWKVFFVVGGLG